MNEQIPENKPKTDSMPEKSEGMKSRETKLLTEEGFNDFLQILEEINGESLDGEVIERSRQDFMQGLYKVLQIYEKGDLALADMKCLREASGMDRLETIWQMT